MLPETSAPAAVAHAHAGGGDVCGVPGFAAAVPFRSAWISGAVRSEQTWAPVIVALVLPGRWRACCFGAA